MVFVTQEKSDIRSLDIRKLLKGFALTNYIFKNLVTVSLTDGDTIRWYQETPADITVTAPSTMPSGPISDFPYAEHSWQRNESLPRTYKLETFSSNRDLKTTDIDVQARSVLRIMRAVIKAVDTRIYNVLTESQSPSDILTGASAGTGWADLTDGNPILDIMSGSQAIQENDYNMSGGYKILMNPQNEKDLKNYIISVKGSSIPAVSSEQVKRGVLMNILGGDVVVSNNVAAGSVFVGLPATAVTWYSLTGPTSKVIEDPLVGIKIRVLEEGEAVLTDPKASFLITGT